MTLSVNFLCDGVSYPLDRPLPPEVAKQVPADVRELYEIKPGARKSTPPHGAANFVSGVSYPVGPDGTIIKNERTARDEERQLKAQAEMRDAEWEHSGLAGQMESEKTRLANSLREGRE